ncbi:MAG TPA: RICIN domain-containing protein [Cytophagales bacterium]|nr:RICIN domain-containing protein [Cytophagales bacterium]
MKKNYKPLLQIICCTLLMFSMSVQFVNSQTVTSWKTVGNGSARMAQGSATFGANSGSGTTITVNEGTTYQSIDGYGFTLTQGSAKVIAAMGATQQNNLLNELYESGGLGYSVVRIGIGATDMSDYAFSYRDGASFSLAGPDLTYTIPILKKIIAINPNVKVLATPWSAPMWMKTNGSFTGGSLKAENYESYGQYWLDYFNAMKAQGINIWAITPQNEPLNPYNTPSMTLTRENELGLINDYIGPKLRGAGYNCKIIAYDHNCDNVDHPTYVANNSSYVDGAAFHLYAGSISALTTFRNNTGKNVYFTEQYTGAGGSFSGDLVWHTQNVTIGSMNNWSRTAMGWNLATDPNWGPHTAGGCTDCKGAVTISGNSVTRNQGYYIIGHFSKAVRPNAVRIGASSNHGNLITTAFRNSDGTKAVVVLNNSGSSITFRMVWNNASFTHTLEGSSVVTFKWANGSTPPPPSGIVSGATYSVINVHSNKAMEVSNFSTANGGNVQQWDYVGGNSQKWRVTDVGGGAYNFININSGKCLDVADVSTANGGNLHQWDYVGGANQKWQIISNGDGTYRIISVHSGKAADVANVSTANGANIHQWDYVNGNNQKWRFTQVSAARMGVREEEAEMSGIKIFPNPSFGSVTIEVEGEALVSLSTAEGAELFNGMVKGRKNIENLSSGFYLVSIKTAGGFTTKKLLVK